MKERRPDQSVIIAGLVLSCMFRGADAGLQFDPPVGYSAPAHQSIALGDFDGDTLPDYWEEREGLDPNDDGSSDPDMGADGDPDGDGATNRDEYDAGTDPRDPASQPVPVTAPWAVAGLAVVILALTRKRMK